MKAMFGWLAVSTAVALMAGCSDLTATVQGKVEMDGAALKGGEGRRGMVVFRPVAGGATATGKIDPEGRFTLMTGSEGGVRPGDYLAGVRVVEIIPATEDMPAPSGKPITPLMYADPVGSGLEYTVVGGPNTFTISLDSKAGPIDVDLTVEEPSEEEGAEGESTAEDADTGEDSDAEGDAGGEDGEESSADAEAAAEAEAPEAEDSEGEEKSEE